MGTRTANPAANAEGRQASRRFLPPLEKTLQVAKPIGKSASSRAVTSRSIRAAHTRAPSGVTPLRTLNPRAQAAVRAAFRQPETESTLDVSPITTGFERGSESVRQARDPDRLKVHDLRSAKVSPTSMRSTVHRARPRRYEGASIGALVAGAPGNVAAERAGDARTRAPLGGRSGRTATRLSGPPHFATRTEAMPDDRRVPEDAR